MPVVSTLNNPTGTVVANAAIVEAAANGRCRASITYNSTDVIMDINGYFAAPASEAIRSIPLRRAAHLTAAATTVCRSSGELTVNIAGSPCAPSANAAGYVFNATVVPSPRLGYLTLWADSQPMPGVSTLNAYDGFVTSNMAIVPNTDGSTDALAGDGTTQLILDISGYFAP